jgi:hypothetical protein
VAGNDAAKASLPPELDLKKLLVLDSLNQINIDCAKDDQLKILHASGDKKAFVLAEESIDTYGSTVYRNLIALDCTPEMADAWSKAFNSHTPDTDVFFVHELVRYLADPNDKVANSKINFNEDNFKYSMPFIDAAKAAENAENAKMSSDASNLFPDAKKVLEKLHDNFIHFKDSKERCNLASSYNQGETTFTLYNVTDNSEGYLNGALRTYSPISGVVEAVLADPFNSKWVGLVEQILEDVRQSQCKL